MCILFTYRNPDATSKCYRLIVVSNRDEDVKRPTLPAHYWVKHPQCFGGVSITGKAGVILNLSSEANSIDIPKQGRGFLVPNFITSEDTAVTYLDKLHKQNKENPIYNPYVLVLMNLKNADINYLSSSKTSTGPCSTQDSILGFGNSGLDVPYKKVEVGKEIFKNIVNNVKVSEQTNLIDKLLTFLKSEKRYLPDPELQKQSPERYKELSSICVVTEGYRTRTHSILLVNGNNEITFVEETLMQDLTWKRQIFSNKLIYET
ncbi:Uncharacterized protein C22orf25 [Habropoda laboriosa]|uniref:Uncharacterized protein C22orf25 n=1 Tax=Habropoda laboriosa TaxID=597456 RepID=A0A0L7RFK1_9HYME|nr:Uncharacterized protein C22orf25 [Habropoda laboriosa]